MLGQKKGLAVVSEFGSPASSRSGTYAYRIRWVIAPEIHGSGGSRTRMRGYLVARIATRPSDH